jgi:hypothetical protein
LEPALLFIVPQRLTTSALWGEVALRQRLQLIGD